MTIDSMYDGLVTTTSGMKDLLEQELGADVYSLGTLTLRTGRTPDPGCRRCLTLRR